MIRPRATTLALGAAAAFTINLAQATSDYRIVEVYNSSNFFQEFDFFDQPDPTNGFVEYVNATTANVEGLAGFTEGGVYLGVDYTSQTTTGRKSTRVSSKKAFTGGLFIADIAHMPAGGSRNTDSCGIWPAYWMFGPNWPLGGEIDILEGVNTQESNSITLHTGEGCSMSNKGSLGSTKLVQPDCQGNIGCAQETASTENYGAGFNRQGGGVYALEWTDSAISAWFFPRNSSLTAQLTASGSSSGRSTSHGLSAPDTSTFGQPLATFVGGSNCSLSKHFEDHNIVFDTTFCGDWAGKIWSNDSTCSALAAKCEDYVGANPEKFSDAYWLVKEIRIYQKQDGSNASRRRAVGFSA
ncbi:glycoside hydrolase [Podospora australis]|uniref:Glycoside hydrolase n=1 Tax=Podospora australis TaxID=1536484 RepID=A0AAN6X0A5_9PEZI|nr:glycoside hydrolase [Podospora australis]